MVSIETNTHIYGYIRLTICQNCARTTRASPCECVRDIARFPVYSCTELCVCVRAWLFVYVNRVAHYSTLFDIYLASTSHNVFFAHGPCILPTLTRSLWKTTLIYLICAILVAAFKVIIHRRTWYHCFPSRLFFLLSSGAFRIRTISWFVESTHACFIMPWLYSGTLLSLIWLRFWWEGLTFHFDRMKLNAELGH